MASHPSVPARTQPRQQDCLSCRLTGFAAFTGLGGYAIYQASRQGTFKRIRPPGAPIIGGQITAVLGLGLSDAWLDTARKLSAANAFSRETEVNEASDEQNATLPPSRGLLLPSRMDMRETALRKQPVERLLSNHISFGSECGFQVVIPKSYFEAEDESDHLQACAPRQAQAITTPQGGYVVTFDPQLIADRDQAWHISDGCAPLASTPDKVATFREVVLCEMADILDATSVQSEHSNIDRLRTRLTHGRQPGSVAKSVENAFLAGISNVRIDRMGEWGRHWSKVEEPKRVVEATDYINEQIWNEY